jgi:hypothetical protein
MPHSDAAVPTAERYAEDVIRRALKRCDEARHCGRQPPPSLAEVLLSEITVLFQAQHDMSAVLGALYSDLTRLRVEIARLREEKRELEEALHHPHYRRPQRAAMGETG